MSGYISLLDNEAQEMIDNLDSGGMRGLLEPDESMTIKIRNYVNETFDQFCEMKLDFKVEEDVYDIYYGEHFLRFLGNLRRCLYLSCRERDTNPLLEDDADFYALLDTKHSSGDELTQLMKDNHATEPLFFFFDELSFERIQTNSPTPSNPNSRQFPDFRSRYMVFFPTPRTSMASAAVSTTGSVPAYRHPGLLCIRCDPFPIPPFCVIIPLFPG